MYLKVKRFMITRYYIYYNLILTIIYLGFFMKGKIVIIQPLLYVEDMLDSRHSVWFLPHYGTIPGYSIW